MFRSITDEVAWVTGAGSGIGQAGAVALAKAGATLVLSGRRTEPLEETAGMIRAAGGTALIQPADMRDAAQVRAVAKRIEEEFGRCDILVNSAGVNVKNRSWGEVGPEGFDTVVEADLSGPFYASAAVLPMMRRRRADSSSTSRPGPGGTCRGSPGPPTAPRSMGSWRSARA